MAAIPNQVWETLAEICVTLGVGTHPREEVSKSTKEVTQVWTFRDIHFQPRDGFVKHLLDRAHPMLEYVVTCYVPWLHPQQHRHIHTYTLNSNKRKTQWRQMYKEWLVRILSSFFFL